MKSTSLLHHFGHFLYHSYIKIGRFYIISISSKNPPAKSLHHFYTIITDFYTVPTPKFSISTPLLHHSGELDIWCKSQSRTPCLILYVKAQKLYHLYTVPTSDLYCFFDFYIISISLKISMVAGTI